MIIKDERLWCSNCAERVRPVDPYGMDRAFDEGIHCSNCGAPLDVTMAELAARSEQYKLEGGV